MHLYHTSGGDPGAPIRLEQRRQGSLQAAGYTSFMPGDHTHIRSALLHTRLFCELRLLASGQPLPLHALLESLDTNGHILSQGKL